MNQLFTVFERGFAKLWWVIAFSLVCLFIYEATAWNSMEEKKRLIARQQILLARCEQYKKEHIFLLRQLESKEDPYWKALVLKEELGLIEPNQTKIVFDHAN